MPAALDGAHPVPGESAFAPTIADYAHNLLTGTVLRQLDRGKLGKSEFVDLILQRVRSAGGPRQRPPRGPHPPVAANLALIGDLVGLDAVQRAVLQFLLALHENQDLKEISDAFGDVTLARAVPIVAAATTISEEGVLAALASTSRLLCSGLIEVDRRDDWALWRKITVKAGILDAVLTRGLDRERLLSRFLPEAPPSTLSWPDFAHLEEGACMARDLLRAAVRLRRSGINILLYGTTGTGKTELARLLAAEVGSNLYVANAANPEGESASARERLSSLLLGQRLVGSGLLLFDELEDLFTPGWHDLWRDTSRARPSMSKQWFNDLLESNPIPTLWITNSVEGIDPAFLRRFTYAVEFRSLGPRQRARVLARHIADESAVSPSEVDSIAERFSVSPAQLGSAVAATRMIRPERPDRSTLERVLEPLEKLTRDGPRNPHHSFDVSGYRIDALNSPDDLSGIVDRLASWTSDRGPGVSLCLYGPPGTGKSAYVQYLAHRMGRPVLYRHCSDILGCFVGETEKQIARAFRQAEEEEAVLLFDEVDSFLCDRRGARQSWEVTQVNEFLQQLESFRGVVACTTNLWHALDEASLRRFVFKIEFRYLEVDQAIELFHATFAGCLAAPLTDAEEAAVRGAFARVRNLAPGDFAAVARRERALGRHPNAAALVASLTAEVGAKPGASRRIGF